MSIYLYSDSDGKVEVIGASYIGNVLSAKVKLLELFSDGTGLIGDVSNKVISTLFADGGMAEIIQSCERFVKFQGKELDMQTQLQEATSKSLADVTKLYNSLVPASKQVKRFSDKQTALKKLTAAFAGNMTSSKNKAVKKPSSAKNDNDPKKAKAAKPEAKKVALPKAAKAPKSPRIPGQITLVGKKSIYAGKFLYKISKESPRREGSHGWKSWNALRDGMTYEQFIINHGVNKHLAFDIKAGHIEVRSKPKQS